MKRQIVEVPNNWPIIPAKMITQKGVRFLKGVKVYLVVDILPESLIWPLNVEFTDLKETSEDLCVELDECLGSLAIPANFFVPANAVMDSDDLSKVISLVLKKGLKEFYLEYNEESQEIDIALRIGTEWFSGQIPKAEKRLKNILKVLD